MDFAAHRHLFVLLVAAAQSSYADDYVFVDSFESSDCSQPLTCAGVSGTCVSGQLADAAAAGPLRARFNIGLGCGSSAIGGPCDLSVTAHDAVDFATNPGASNPLSAGETIVDGCGRYRFANLTTSSSGYVAIVTDDAPGGTTYMPAQATHALAVNQHVDGMTAIAARFNDVNAWGLMAGQNYVNSGALLLMFRTGATPTAAVSVTGTGIARYFSDTDAARYSASSAATSTGANGSALYSSGTASSASGGESGGCVWPPINRTSVTGVVAYAKFVCQEDKKSPASLRGFS